MTATNEYGGVNIPELEILIKPDVMGWINQAISDAALSGVTIILPNNIAYLDQEQSFTERQVINTTRVDADGNSKAGLTVGYSLDPPSDDLAVISIGTWSSAGIAAGNAEDYGSVWGSYGVAGHNGAGTVAGVSGIVGHAENSASGIVGVARGGEFGVRTYGAGTITNGAGVYVVSPVVSAGSITNLYGVFIEAQTAGATTNYALYAAGGKSFFQDAVAIGAVSTNRQLYAYKTTTDSGGFTSVESELAINSTINTANAYVSLKGTAYIDAASSEAYTGNIVGVYGYAAHAGSGALTGMRAVLALAENGSAVTVSQSIAVLARITNSGAGTTTASIGVWVSTPTISAGAITSAAGVLIEGQTNATNNTNLLIGTGTIPAGTFSVYNSSTAVNYFAGRIGIGDTGPDSALEIGNLSDTGYITLNEVVEPGAIAANKVAFYAKDDAGTTKLYFKIGSTESQVGTPSSGGAPDDATYVTLSTNATLTSERVLTAGLGITITDAGAGSTITVASNSWVFISEATASASASFIFTGLSSVYKFYVLVLRNVKPATDSSELLLTLSIDNGATYLATNYAYFGQNCDSSSSSVGVFNSASSSRIQLTDNSGNAAAEAISGEIYLLNMPNAVNSKEIHSNLVSRKDSGNIAGHPVWGHNTTTSAVTAAKLEFDSGNIASGTCALYGVL